MVTRGARVIGRVDANTGHKIHKKIHNVSENESRSILFVFFVPLCGYHPARAEVF